LNFILDSDAFKVSRNKENMGLVPHMLEYVNLRAFSHKEKADVSQIDYINPKIASMNELYDKTNQEIEMKEFALVDVFPAKYHKRHMAANVL
jgi:hypothetical protein